LKTLGNIHIYREEKRIQVSDRIKEATTTNGDDESIASRKVQFWPRLPTIQNLIAA